MKKYLLLSAILFSSLITFSQSRSDLQNFNMERNKITRHAMIILGGWSAANVIYGSIATNHATGSGKYFQQMNIMWGGINLAFAAAGYFGTRNKDGLSLIQSLKQQAGIEKTYLLNIGLDAAYIAGGFYLKERSYNVIKNPARLKGYGQSIILQGAALFILDGVLFGVHNSHGRKLYKLVDKLQLSATGNGIGVTMVL